MHTDLTFRIRGATLKRSGYGEARHEFLRVVANRDGLVIEPASFDELPVHRDLATGAPFRRTRMIVDADVDPADPRFVMCRVRDVRILE